MSINLLVYVPWLFILVGVLVMILPFTKSTSAKTLATKGERCEGIVFQLGYKERSGLWLQDDSDIKVKDKITIRFVTNKQEWITADLDTESMLLWTGQYKEGDRVTVIYNPENPNEFTIETKQSLEVKKLVFIIIGIVLIGVGVSQLLQK